MALLRISITYLLQCNSSVAEIGMLEWKNCTEIEFQSWFVDSSPEEGLLCSYLRVPLQYDGNTSLPSSSKNKQFIQIATTRLPANGPKLGNAVLISGGPGYPGIDLYVASQGPASKLRENFDIIRYDPRGVGQSRPSINCNITGKQSEPIIGSRNSDRQDHKAILNETLDSCIRQTGAEFLQSVGTHEAVSDLDILRQALGEPKLTAIAYSYGTEVAQRYALRFPDNVRAIVLDGVSNIIDDDFTVNIDQAKSFQNSFVRFARACAMASDCFVPGDERGAVERYHSLLRKLDKTPLQIDNKNSEQITIDAEALISLTISLLIQPDDWPVLAHVLRQLGTGTLDKITEDAFREDSNNSINDALTVITCADLGSSTDDAEVLAVQKKRIEREMRFAYYRETDPPPTDICDVWPWPSKRQNQKLTLPKEIPSLLFVAHRYDPATPWQNAWKMAKFFASPLVTRQGDGHTLVLTDQSRCIDKLAVDYLYNPDNYIGDTVCPNHTTPTFSLTD